MTILLNVSRLGLAVLLATGFMITGCKKKEIQGPKGEPGTPGKGGNANITSTNVFTIPSSLWVADSVAKVWNVSLVSSLVTKDVVDKGSVKAFVSVGNDWYELPYLNGDQVIQFGFAEGLIYLRCSEMHEALPEQPETANYRLVVLSEL